MTQGCALRKIQGSPVLWICEIQGTQHMICMKIVRFSSSPRANVKRHRPPGSARVQACGNNDISQFSDARFSLNFCSQIERWELHQEPAVMKMFSYIWWVHMPSEIAVKLNFLEWLISVKLRAPAISDRFGFKKKYYWLLILKVTNIFKIWASSVLSKFVFWTQFIFIVLSFLQPYKNG